jgi:hypothetical protein
MEKTMAMLRKIVLFRSGGASVAIDSTFEMRMNKINRARQVANSRGPIFKNRPSQSKA